jgi:hypothetical protein
VKCPSERCYESPAGICPWDSVPSDATINTVLQFVHMTLQPSLLLEAEHNFQCCAHTPTTLGPSSTRRTVGTALNISFQYNCSKVSKVFSTSTLSSHKGQPWQHIKNVRGQL